MNNNNDDALAAMIKSSRLSEPSILSEMAIPRETRFFGVEMKKPKYSGFDALSCHDNDPISVYALKQAYRKHAMQDDSIGWEELQDILYNALAQIMGDNEFVEWKESVGDKL